MPVALSIQTIISKKSHELHRVKLLMPALCRIRQGRKIIQWRGQTETANPSQIIIFPAGYEFYIENIPEGGRYLSEIISIPSSVIRMNHRHYPPEPKKNDALRFCSRVTRELEYCWEQLKSAIDAELSTPLLEHLASGLILMLREAGHGVFFHSPEGNVVSRCQNLIMLSPSFHWTARDMAAQLHMSVSGLHRKLAAEGESFQAVLNDVRLGNALYAIQTTDKPISEIAMDNGYQCASRFTASFKKRYQITPRALRQATNG
ncbi:AraC family transcriptional regulator [Escherichia coli]|uniref:AraC family transcriptional regulator n=1 Tax=Escherichia coli TaxID=562 RepID=UPI0005CD1336|nr:AraC family transcriptional regulator [Escherichia coli]